MFETAELGHRVSKQEFKQREPELHAKLLDVQRQLRDANFPVIIIVSGVEGAGKGSVVSALHKWMDVRGLRTAAFWDETDEEKQRPRYWRFWRTMPPRGTVGVMFGSWYTDPIINRVLKRRKRSEFDRSLDEIRQFEETLANDGTLIIKLWFHLSEKAQKKRLKQKSTDDLSVSPYTKDYAKHYERFARICEHVIKKTDVDYAPWHIIESEDPRYRDLRTAEIVLKSLSLRLEDGPRRSVNPPIEMSVDQASQPSILDTVCLTRKLDKARYKKLLQRYQSDLYRLAWQAHQRGINTVAVFEGWDAAGKGGAIRRVTQAMDARLYRVISIAAPTDEEKAQHYLWRFWRHIPRSGYHTLYDRSWYGRVLVERVEGFARNCEWQRAYTEINAFEQQLVDHQVVVMKFWLHIDPDEQMSRFCERENTVWKKHKITAEDWRNRDRWQDYEVAVADMVARTSTDIAPWTLVSGNDKYNARIEVLETFVERLDKALN